MVQQEPRQKQGQADPNALSYQIEQTPHYKCPDHRLHHQRTDVLAKNNPALCSSIVPASTSE